MFLNWPPLVSGMALPVPIDIIFFNFVIKFEIRKKNISTLSRIYTYFDVICLGTYITVYRPPVFINVGLIQHLTIKKIKTDNIEKKSSFYLNKWGLVVFIWLGFVIIGLKRSVKIWNLYLI